MYSQFKSRCWYSVLTKEISRSYFHLCKYSLLIQELPRGYFQCLNAVTQTQRFSVSCLYEFI